MNGLADNMLNVTEIENQKGLILLIKEGTYVLNKQLPDILKFLTKTGT